MSKKITEGDLDYVIDTLEDEPTPFDKDFDDLSDKDAKETLKTIVKMGHEEYKTEVKKETKEDKGEDTSEEEEELEKINEKIEDIKKKFKEKIVKLNNQRKTVNTFPDIVIETDEPEVLPDFTDDESGNEVEEEEVEEEEVEEEGDKDQDEDN